MSPAIALMAAMTVGQLQIDLPLNASRHYVTVFVHDPAVRNTHPAVRMWFEEPSLSRIRETVGDNFNIYDPSQSLWRTRWAKRIGNNLPAVLIQAPDGRVLFKVSGENYPPTGADMAGIIARSLSVDKVSNCWQCNPCHGRDTVIVQPAQPLHQIEDQEPLEDQFNAVIPPLDLGLDQPPFDDGYYEYSLAQLVAIGLLIGLPLLACVVYYGKKMAEMEEAARAQQMYV